MPDRNIMSDSVDNSNIEKSHKNHLRKNSQNGSLENAPASPQANRRVSRNNIGGKVDTTQPPLVSGFFMPAISTGDNISLSGGYGIKNRLRGNTCGASYVAPRDSRQFCDCHHSRNNVGINAMNANTHGTATPVASTQGASSHPCSCTLLSTVLSDTISQAKTEAAIGGKFGTANAYADLLQKFHAAILPAFISETKGNTSQIARLLGIDRASVMKYATSAGLNHLIGRTAQEVAK